MMKTRKTAYLVALIFLKFSVNGDALSSNDKDSELDLDYELPGHQLKGKSLIGESSSWTLQKTAPSTPSWSNTGSSGWLKKKEETKFTNGHAKGETSWTSTSKDRETAPSWPHAVSWGHAVYPQGHTTESHPEVYRNRLQNPFDNQHKLPSRQIGNTFVEVPASEAERSAHVESRVHGEGRNHIEGRNHQHLGPTYPPQPPVVIPTPPSEIAVTTTYTSQQGYSHLQPSSYQQFHSRGKPCVVYLNGKPVSCYQRTKLYRIKLDELRRISSVNDDYFFRSHGNFNSCHEVDRKKRAIYFPEPRISKIDYDNRTESSNSSRSNSKNTNFDNNPVESQATYHYYAHGDYAQIDDHPRPNPEQPQPQHPHKEEHITGHCVSSSYTLLKPYYSYNANGELRFIVQDTENVEQCQPKAVCSLTPESYLHFQRGCDSLGLETKFHCERKLCHHQLLTWDPEDPHKGPFIDHFDFECCCRCSIESNYSDPLRPSWLPCLSEIGKSKSKFTYEWLKS